MTCRVEGGETFLQTYNAENRLSGVALVSGDCDTPGDISKVWQFTYDGDGSRVKQVYTEGTSTLTTYYFMGGSYEVQTDGTTETSKQYYGISGMTVAVRLDSTWTYFLTDHLGSVVATTDAGGTVLSQTRYTEFGEIRTDVGSVTQTDFGFTFQRNIADMGLMDYKARFYSSLLGRFIQPDSLVPGAANPQKLNRYTYSNNNPINFIDPSGHKACDDEYGCWDEPEDPGDGSGGDDDGNGGGDGGEDGDGQEGNNSNPQIKRTNSIELPCIFGFEVTCNNVNQAFNIILNPNSTDLQKIGSGYYIYLESGHRILFLIGIGMIIWEIAIPTSALCAANPGCIERAKSAGTTVLGRYPDYLNVAEVSNANVFNIPPEVYNGLSAKEAWAMNQQFLDDAIARGDTFILASKWAEASVGSTYLRELQYMFSKGYTISWNQTYLLPPR